MVIKNFFSSNLLGRILFPFFSHKLSITFVLHAIFFFRRALARQELNDMITRLIDRVVAKQLVNITKCSASEVICIMRYSKPFLNKSPEADRISPCIPASSPGLHHPSCILKSCASQLAPSVTHIYRIPSNKRPTLDLTSAHPPPRP